MPAAEDTRELAEELGRRIRYTRTALSPSTSQERLAAQAGLHRAYLGRVERGQVSISVYNMVRIANALGIDPAELVRGLRT